MLFGFWINIRGPARLWVASIGFTLAGALIVFALPRYLPALHLDAIGSFALRALGWTFIGLGSLVLVPMLITLKLRIRHREREAVWHWWINFIGALAGALAFAVPAALMFPVFLLAYALRPNALFASEAVVANNLWIAALFSVLGVVVLFAVYFVARLKMREDPRRGL